MADDHRIAGRIDEIKDFNGTDLSIKKSPFIDRII
jgi:hypothetical protein